MVIALVLAFAPVCDLAAQDIAPTSQPNSPPVNQSRDIVQPQLDFIGVYAPYVLDSQADRMRAQGEFLIDLAVFDRMMIENRIAEYELKRARLEFRINLLQTQILLRALRFEQEQMIADFNLQRQLNNADRKETRITDLDIPGATAAKGATLNDLLSFIPNEVAVVGLLDKTTPISLPETIKSDLAFLLGSGHFEARISPDAQQFKYRPPAKFKDGEYQPWEEEFRNARERMLAAVGQNKDVDDKDYESALAALEKLMELNQREFVQWKATQNGEYSNRDRPYIAFREAQQFVDEQTRQLSYLAGATQLPTAFAGTTIQDLVEYMKKNGFRFAQADSQSASNTYKAVGDGMVALYKQLVEMGVIDRKGTGGRRYRSAVE